MAVTAIPCLAWGAAASVQGTSANFTNLTAVSRAFNSNVAAESLLFATIRNAAESSSVTSVTDTVNSGQWTTGSASFPYDHTAATMRTWCYYRENAAAGATTVTVNFSAQINGTFGIGEFSGIATSNSLFTVYVGSQSVAGDRVFISSPIVATGAGIIVGAFTTAQTIQLAVGAGEVDTTLSNTRGHLVSRVISGAGTYTVQADPSPNEDSGAIVWHGFEFHEPLAAGGEQPTILRNAIIRNGVIR